MAKKAARYMPFLIGGLVVAGCGTYIQGTQPNSNNLPEKTSAGPTRTLFAAPETPEPVNRFLIKARDDASARLAIAASGGRQVDEIEELDVKVVVLPDTNVEERAEKARQQPGVLYVEPDYIVHVADIPVSGCPPVAQDYVASDQYGLDRINAPEAWCHSTGQSVKIAVLDTGIDANHPDFAGKIVLQKNIITGGATAVDGHGHGTHVAGIAAAMAGNNDFDPNTPEFDGVVGTGYNASLMIGKVLDDAGSAYTSTVVNGINWAADNGANVINMSFGGPGFSLTMSSAVSRAWNKGVVLVGAAGNSATNTQFFPAAYTSCIAVAATSVALPETKAYFSNYGSWVDVAAPGENILSTLPTYPFYMQTAYPDRQIPNNFGRLSGTSMATPFVAGEAAVLWSKYRTAYPKDRLTETRTKVRNAIEKYSDTSVASSNSSSGWAYGRIDLNKAVHEDATL